MWWLELQKFPVNEQFRPYPPARGTSDTRTASRAQIFVDLWNMFLPCDVSWRSILPGKPRVCAEEFLPLKKGSDTLLSWLINSLSCRSASTYINKQKARQNLLTKLKTPCKSRTNNTVLNCFSITWRIGQVSVIYNGLRDLNSLRQWNFLRLFTNGHRAKAFKS